jgi:CBS domain-containing protein
MTKTYNPLPVLKLTENTSYTHQTEFPAMVRLDDPALNIMVTLETSKPPIAAPGNTIDDTLVDMKASGTHIMLVIDDEKVEGVISSEDILGERPTKIAQARRITHDKILVRAVMTPREKLAAIDYDEIRFSKVGRILATLKETKQHYAIVVDTDSTSNKQTIHGLIYIYDIVKRLNKDLVTELRAARSLLELKRDFD